MPPQSILTHEIKKEARHLGFDAVGIARVSAPRSTSVPPPQETVDAQHPSVTQRLWSRLIQWLEWRFHGTMDWMARDPNRRSDPAEVLPGCQSLIVVGMNYYTNQVPDESNGAGRIARYAWGKDYHHVLKERLVQLESYLHNRIPEIQTKSYVDTGPIMEKPWAQEAGIGWIGKHTNLISTDFGSWLVLGEILTTMPLESDEAAWDLCGTCSLCIQACPTGAIVDEYLLDAERCISYLTIEYRGNEHDLSPEIRKKIGNKIFGCDDCLDICPFNVHAKPTGELAFHPTSLTLHPHLPTLANLSQEEFHALTKHSPLRRAKHEGFIRNVRIGLNNLTSSDFPTPIR
jgi:epoxyqueuosine reductase